jgi:hypothetical protein
VEVIIPQTVSIFSRESFFDGKKIQDVIADEINNKKTIERRRSNAYLRPYLFGLKWKSKKK